MKRSLSLVGILGLAVAHPGCSPSQSSAQAPSSVAADSQPGTRMSVEQLKEKFFHISAGRRLKPKAWPNGAKVGVTLTFHLDNAAGALARGNFTPYWSLSQGQYGGLDGLPRVLRLLDKHDIPASFFVPVVSDILQPSIIPSILAKKRHEIGAHGWIHENQGQLSEPEEKRLLDQSVEYLTKVVGKRPVSFASPGSTFRGAASIKMLTDAGFTNDTSLMASDDAYEINVDGKPSGLVELPIEWILDDAPYFTRTGTLPSPEAIFQVYKDEFDVAYEEGGYFNLTMHPHVIGHRSRIMRLDKLVSYMKSKPGVWFATTAELTDYVKKNATREP